MKKIISFSLCAALISSLLGIMPSSAAFQDIGDADTAYAVAVLQSMGIVDGYSDGTFRPNENLTRAQFCKMAIVAMGLGGQISSYSRKTLFTDVPGGQWYSGYINLAYAKGAVNGYGNGYFGPNDPVSYGQAITILIRMLGYTSADVGNLWPTDYINFADDIGLTEGLIGTSVTTVTRADAAQLFFNLLQADTASGVAYPTTVASTTLSSAILLSNSATAEDGTPECARIYFNGESAYYKQAITVPAELIGAKGIVLLDSSGAVCGFVPDNSTMVEATVSSATSGKLTATNGSTYTISADTALIYRGEKYAWGTGYVNVKSSCSIKLYFNASGTVETVYIPTATGEMAAVAASENGNSILASFVSKLGVAGNYKLFKNGENATAANLAKYDVATYDASGNVILVSDWRVTGAVESVYPSTDAPSMVTVAGYTYKILDCARDDFSSLSLGDSVTLLLTTDTCVAAAKTETACQSDMIGILSKTSEGYSVQLPGGYTVSGTSATAIETKRIGTLVKVTSTGIGKISVSALEKTEASGKVNISEHTVGSYQIAPGAVIYEWVGSGYVTEISLSDITWTETLSASYVSYAHLNSAGQVDILLLNDVTGNCYTYGLAKTGKVSGSSLSTSVSTVIVENSIGSTGALTGGSGVRNNTFIGVSENASGAVVKTITLTSAAVSRNDFNGSGYVEVNGILWRIAENVQIYNGKTGTWYVDSSSLGSALEQVLAYSNDLTVYYDRTASTGGMIRIIVVE